MGTACSWSRRASTACRRSTWPAARSRRSSKGLDLGGRVIPGTLPHGGFNGVAVGPNGSIFVTEDVTNTVYEFAR